MTDPNSAVSKGSGYITSPPATVQADELRAHVSVISTKEYTGHFKLVLLATCVFTAIFIAAWLSMVIFPVQTPEIADAAGGCKLFAGSGFGAILGLIGGKAT